MNIKSSLSAELFFNRTFIFFVSLTQNNIILPAWESRAQNCTCLTLSIFNFFAAEYTSFTSSLSAFNLVKAEICHQYLGFFKLKSTPSSFYADYLLSSVSVIQQNFHSFWVEIIEFNMGNSMRIAIAVEDFEQVGTAARQHGSVRQHLVSAHLDLKHK